MAEAVEWKPALLSLTIDMILASSFLAACCGGVDAGNTLKPTDLTVISCKYCNTATSHSPMTAEPGGWLS